MIEAILTKDYENDNIKVIFCRFSQPLLLKQHKK